MGGGIFNRESSEKITRTAHRSCVTTKIFSFSQQIEKFSWQLRRNFFASPMNHCNETDCNWTLVIGGIRDSVRYQPELYNCDYIDFSLKRNVNKKEYQSINVRLTVMDSCGISPLCASKEIHFTPSMNEEIVLRMTVSELYDGFCGLNKVRFLPNDTLTVECEIATYETAEESYANADELEDTRKYVKKEIFEWMQKFVVLILVPLLLQVYIFFNFVLPLISWIFVWLQIIVFFLHAIATFLLIRLILFVWSFMKPGGDRTYYKSKNNQ